jgi:hypothetical protein
MRVIKFRSPSSPSSYAPFAACIARAVNPIRIALAATTIISELSLICQRRSYHRVGIIRKFCSYVFARDLTINARGKRPNRKHSRGTQPHLICQGFCAIERTRHMTPPASALPLLAGGDRTGPRKQPASPCLFLCLFFLLAILFSKAVISHARPLASASGSRDMDSG